MNLLEVILIGISLAMDAFSVSICKGLSMKKINKYKALIIGLYFGIFQGIMPIIGYYLGNSFYDLITNYDHWIAFALLLFIGLNMIKESFSKDNKSSNDKTDFKTMFPLAIATSIDALAVGITFSIQKTNIFLESIIICIITFILSIIGVILGKKVGNKFGKKASILGGLVLIIIGIKILFEHLGVLLWIKSLLH